MNFQTSKEANLRQLGSFQNNLRTLNDIDVGRFRPLCTNFITLSQADLGPAPL